MKFSTVLEKKWKKKVNWFIKNNFQKEQMQLLPFMNPENLSLARHLCCQKSICLICIPCSMIKKDFFPGMNTWKMKHQQFENYLPINLKYLFSFRFRYFYWILNYVQSIFQSVPIFHFSGKFNLAIFHAYLNGKEIWKEKKDVEYLLKSIR